MTGKSKYTKRLFCVVSAVVYLVGAALAEPALADEESPDAGIDISGHIGGSDMITPLYRNPRTGKEFQVPETDEEQKIVDCAEFGYWEEISEKVIKRLSYRLKNDIIDVDPYTVKFKRLEDRRTGRHPGENYYETEKRLENSARKRLKNGIARYKKKLVWVKECKEFMDGLARANPEALEIWDEGSKEDKDKEEQVPEAGTVEGLIQDPDSWNDSHAPYITDEGVKAPDVGMGEVPDFPPGVAPSDRGAGEPSSQEAGHEFVLPSPYPSTASSNTSCLKSLKKPDGLIPDHNFFCPRFAKKYTESCCNAYADYYEKAQVSAEMWKKAYSARQLTVPKCRQLCDSSTVPWRIVMYNNEMQILTLLTDEGEQLDQLNAKSAKLTAEKESAEFELAKVSAGRIIYLYENTNSGKLIEHAGNYFEPKPPLRYVGEKREVDTGKRDSLKTKVSLLAESIAELSEKKSLSGKSRSEFMPYVLPICAPEMMTQHIRACYRQCDMQVDEGGKTLYSPPNECARGQSPSLTARRTHWQLRQYGFDVHPLNKATEDP